MYFRVGCDVCMYVRTYIYIRSVNAFMHTVEHIVHTYMAYVCMHRPFNGPGMWRWYFVHTET